MSNILRLEKVPKLKLGQVLRSELARLNLSQQEFAIERDLSRATVNNLINTKYPATRAVAEKLAEATGRTVEFWLRTEFSERDLVPPEVAQTQLSEASLWGRLAQADILAFVESGDLGIAPFDQQLVEPTSVDLRCANYIENSSGERIDVATQPYFLMPGETMRLDTLELLKMPYNIVGSIAGMGRYVKRFIVYGIGDEVDLGFEGRIGFTITNMGVEPFRIAAGMKIITARFYLMAQKSQTQYPGTPPLKKLPDPSPNGGLALAIRMAMEGAYQTTIRAGVVEHSIAGTDFGFNAQSEIDVAKRLPLFLNEISEMRDRLARRNEEIRERIAQNKDDAIDGSEHSECESIWAFLGSIEITIADIQASMGQLQTWIDQTDDHHVVNLKKLFEDNSPETKITIGELDDQAGLSPFDIVLQAFKKHG